MATLKDHVMRPHAHIKRLATTIVNHGTRIKNNKVAKEKTARHKLDSYLQRAGYRIKEKDLIHILSGISGIVSVLVPLYWILFRIEPLESVVAFVWIYFWIALVTFPLCYLLSVLIFFVATDLRIDARKSAIEKHFPEFLHLTAANIRAGMPIDQALWGAVRPKFGILCKEIETVAKRSMVGDDLTTALRDFAVKYDSKVIRRTVSLIAEGIEAGSEIGDLLENVALSIEDLQTRKESMSANVTSNVIFIMFSVLVAAPILFAISVQLLDVIHVMGDSLIDTESMGNAIDFSISLSADAVQKSDFLIFCYLSLILSSIMANIIISTIKTGKASDSVKKIPVTIAVSIIIFLVAQWVLGNVFAGLF